MQETKLRKWNPYVRYKGKTGIMEPVIKLTWDEETGELTNCITKTGDFFKMEGQEIDIIQYTGLIDKNGVEWWEGDILKVDDNDDDTTCIIVYDAPAFKKKYKDIQDLINIDSIDLELFYVAGNIYENGDLL